MLNYTKPAKTSHNLYLFSIYLLNNISATETTIISYQLKPIIFTQLQTNNSGEKNRNIHTGSALDHLGPSAKTRHRGHSPGIFFKFDASKH